MLERVKLWYLMWCERFRKAGLRAESTTKSGIRLREDRKEEVTAVDFQDSVR